MESKRITLHRADHVIPDQTVMVHTTVPTDATSAIHPGGPKVRDAFSAARVPLGYMAKLRNGTMLELDDDLYEHVDNGDTVEVVPTPKPDGPQNYPKMLFKAHEEQGKPHHTVVVKDPDHEAKMAADGFSESIPGAPEPAEAAKAPESVKA